MNKENKIYLTWIVLALAVAGMYMGFYFPQRVSIGKIDAEIRTLTADLDSFGAECRGGRNISEEIKKAQEQKFFYERKLLAHNQMPEAIQSISELLASNNLKIMSILPMEVSDLEGSPTGEWGLVKTVFSVDVTGTYIRLMDFMEQVVSHKTMVTIEELEVNRPDSDTGAINIKILIGVYLRKTKV